MNSNNHKNREWAVFYENNNWCKNGWISNPICWPRSALNKAGCLMGRASPGFRYSLLCRTGCHHESCQNSHACRVFVPAKPVQGYNLPACISKPYLFFRKWIPANRHETSGSWAKAYQPAFFRSSPAQLPKRVYCGRRLRFSPAFQR